MRMASAAIHAKLDTLVSHGISTTLRDATDLGKWMSSKKNYMIVRVQGLGEAVRYLIAERSIDGRSETLLSYTFDRFDEALKMKRSLEAQDPNKASQEDE